MELFNILRVVRQDIFQYLCPKDHLNLSIIFKDLSFLRKNTLSQLNHEDHLFLTNIFMDDYILFLIEKLDYKKTFYCPYYNPDLTIEKEDYDSVIKFILENISLENLCDKTLNKLNKGFWNHISSKCKLSEKFIFKWSHRINMFRFKLNSKYRIMSDADFLDRWLLPRQFSKKFHTLFPGFKHYCPCSICFDDLDYHYKAYFENNEWICEKCNDELFGDDDSLFDDYYEPPDRRWSEDDTDYED
ncbi:hypothetical protein IIV22_069R [Invertebrate iridescent virus 22]|uniref:Uncharacterized protein n=1 Tax=Invertebrate iridescent virus 22 TaxID=345198 RepID=S6DAW9_9VIRU|nr:hypothetical protein IIV22_069R [Invertebrate iridescent virus 22]CCV01746.1 hypothetical protein IIV22_069R [Invertebrate iridescent virus 22]